MPQISPARYLTTAGWDDVPHLTESAKQEILASTPPYLREARSQGAPSLGAGAIYPISPAEVWIDPFPIPDWWPRAYALDVGWKVTAALWGAWNPADGVLYPYAEYYRTETPPLTHAQAIKARGDWIRGAIDPASRGRSQIDGRNLLDEYNHLGLKLTPAENAVESGLYTVWGGLEIGRIRPFRTLHNLWREYRTYRRDEKGRVVKTDDHLMDCFRYLAVSGKAIARVRPADKLAGTAPRFVPADPHVGY